MAVPEANLFLLCGCPGDSVKHLKKLGLIITKEEQGHTFETGPNAVLLSDVMIQAGNFANLAEFPVLQMLYKQGMIIPNHPGNVGIKPLLIGSADQVQSQLSYIYRGNYGLISQEEIMAAGTAADRAKDMMRLKLKFAFGEIRESQDLLDSLVLADEAAEVRNGVRIQRMASNYFRLSYKNECVDIDLNLGQYETYQVPYKLDYHNIGKEYFAVIHSGEGDGWDCHRPCMGSILTFQGKLYLIDAGPNILQCLFALGIGSNEIEGIFISHIHDDHFAGLTSVMRSDHRLKFYTTPLVRHSVAKKLSALVGMKEEELDEYFEVFDLAFDEWNSVDGLQVKPIFSPHPVETACFFFRAFWQGGYKTYAHLADTVSLEVLRDMITEDASQHGLSQADYEDVKRQYAIPTQLKKVDIGGGPIHGDAEDFRDDTSDKMVLAHVARALTPSEKEIGSGAPFGTVDVLIPAYQDYARSNALHHLHSYFSSVPVHQIRVLLNNPVELFNPETILMKKGVVNSDIYLILSGSVEAIRADKGIQRVLTAGSFIGEASGLNQIPTAEVYRALSFVNALRMPLNLYLGFLQQNDLHEDIHRLQTYRNVLQQTWLFQDMLTQKVQNELVRSMSCHAFAAGHVFPKKTYEKLHMVAQGEVEVVSASGKKRCLETGNFWGEEGVICGQPNAAGIRVVKDTEVYAFPGALLGRIPIVRWKLFAALKKNA